MNLNIKKFIDSRDIKTLRIIFIDSFEIDPTFEKYEEGFKEAKKIEGFFEDYLELTTIIDNDNLWDKEYWLSLKYDLSKNFSEKRFSHMLCVAKIVFKEKVEKLLAKRAEQKEIKGNKLTEKQKNIIEVEQLKKDSNTFIIRLDKDKNKEEEERIKKLTIENNKIYKEVKKQQQMEEPVAVNNLDKKRKLKESSVLKKAMGIALILIATIVVMTNQRNPQTEQKEEKETALVQKEMEEMQKTKLATDSIMIQKQETIIHKASQTLEIATHTMKPKI